MGFNSFVNYLNKLILSGTLSDTILAVLEQKRINYERKKKPYFSQSSLGESVSGTNTYYYTGQIKKTDYEEWDSLAYKLENGLKKLIESLEIKKYEGTWNDSYTIKESNEIYRSSCNP
jgi:hypothetical protein